MENQNINQEQVQEQTNETRGWKDVNIVADMPLSAIVHFLNILNQRLCNIEGNLVVTQEDGTQLSLTEIYKLQEQAQNNQQGE